MNKLLAQPASIDHAQLQDGEEAAAPAADAAAPADAAAAAPAPDGALGNLQATMGKFAPHLDKIHWPEK